MRGSGECSEFSLLVNEFRNIREYDAIDLSMNQLRNAKELLNSGPRSPVNLINSTFEEFSPRRTYELVLAVEVLQHVPESRISDFVEKVVNLSTKYAINLDWHRIEPKTQVFPHNFIHDYPTLYMQNKRTTEVQTIRLERRFMGVRTFSSRQSIFLARIGGKESPELARTT